MATALSIPPTPVRPRPVRLPPYTPQWSWSVSSSETLLMRPLPKSEPPASQPSRSVPASASSSDASRASKAKSSKAQYRASRGLFNEDKEGKDKPRWSAEDDVPDLPKLPPQAPSGPEKREKKERGEREMRSTSPTSTKVGTAGAKMGTPVRSRRARPATQRVRRCAPTPPSSPAIVEGRRGMDGRRSEPVFGRSEGQGGVREGGEEGEGLVKKGWRAIRRMRRGESSSG